MIIDENNNIGDYDELCKIVYDLMRPKDNYLKLFHKSNLRGHSIYRNVPIESKCLCVEIRINPITSEKRN